MEKCPKYNPSSHPKKQIGNFRLMQQVVALKICKRTLVGPC
jgi:hypothetical protein